MRCKGTGALKPDQLELLLIMHLLQVSASPGGGSKIQPAILRLGLSRQPSNTHTPGRGAMKRLRMRTAGPRPGLERERAAPRDCGCVVIASGMRYCACVSLFLPPPNTPFLFLATVETQDCRCCIYSSHSADFPALDCLAKVQK